MSNVAIDIYSSTGTAMVPYVSMQERSAVLSLGAYFQSNANIEFNLSLT